MRFYIQSIDNTVKHDFSFTLINSIDFLKWKNPTEDVSYTLQEDVSNACIKQIPIGTVEFVSNYLKKINIPIPKPINVPDALLHSAYSGRYIYNALVYENEITMGQVRKANQFCKSNDIIKLEHVPNNYNLSDETYLLPGRYQLSTFVDIVSEWRCFVYRNEIVGLHNYAGDFSVFPDMQLIKGLVRQYSRENTYSAYVLDVGVDPGRVLSTFVIEVHDFFSVGFYGFNRRDLIPYMFSNWYFQYVNCVNSA